MSIADKIPVRNYENPEKPRSVDLAENLSKEEIICLEKIFIGVKWRLDKDLEQPLIFGRRGICWHIDSARGELGLPYSFLCLATAVLYRLYKSPRIKPDSMGYWFSRMKPGHRKRIKLVDKIIKNLRKALILKKLNKKLK